MVINKNNSNGEDKGIRNSNYNSNKTDRNNSNDRNSNIDNHKKKQ